MTINARIKESPISILWLKEDIIKEFEPNSYDNKMILRGINYGINPYSDLRLDSEGMGIK